MPKLIPAVVITFFFNMAYAQSDTIKIKDQLTNITKREGFRNYRNLKLLNDVAAYLYDDFKKYADTVYYQEYQVEGITYKNVICNFGPKDQPLIVIGAHYDVCGDQEGADDNASGVVGLLELARQLKGKVLHKRI